ncbi:heavy metal translocating P-type ATPase [Legionella bononiensis]|uniref:Cation-translocating P-type ATPase n=1 Tax=Legionella bononiensis TaxID=2793102 RepID=A0ABS1WDI1_9GAMM|nr:HAD-IC family P-type ATPase [Legionella bononiensis]MBL7481378.1 cation-translocating P-type ATPase [Legionella bononiensis]MBL7527410.1 cation-translocating P-type ATPase [Legionella bononiensis]
MYYYNYRFHLSDDTQLLEPAKIERILYEANELGIVRVAIDTTSANRSISLLCTSKDQKTIQNQVTQLLLAEEISLSERVELEAVWNENEIKHKDHAHESKPTHSSHPKKHKKNTKQPHSHDHHHGHHHGHSHDHDHHENHWLKATLGLIWGIGLLVISIASFNIPMMAYYVITGLTTLMTFYLGRSVYESAWHTLQSLKWDTTTLYAISTLTIVGVSIASMFVPGLPMMFEAAPLVLGFWHLGEGIEHTLIGKINKKLDVRDCVPPLVLLKGNPDKDISVKQLIPNDMIVVKKGEVIPVDGVVTEETLLYTTRVDGSPHLRMFKPGDVVKSGMRLADHIPSLELRVTKTYQNSYLSLIAKNINKANHEKAPVELFADQVLYYFIPGLLGVALVSGIVIGSLFTPALAIQCVISVLVSACPCALSLITPMAVKIGMKKASEQGIHFNNGKALQAASDIDTVVFDLNGTLTEGKIAVESMRISDENYLSHVALLEDQSDHPAAKIIKSYIQNKGIIPSESLEITSIDKSHHSGIKGIINGETFIIGNKDMLVANEITQFDEPYDNPDNGSVYIVRGTTVIGQIALTDPLRPDAVATVNQLKRLGKTVHICTGADRASAEQYAALLGIPKANISANTVGAITKPGEQSKTSYIQQLQAKGHKVAMVGDAANDITAIAYSDIGIAVKSSIGDTVTEQHAGIVVQQGLLFPIATAFDVAKKTKDNIFQNLFVSLAYNSGITLVAAGLFVAIGFALNPVLGVALMVLESTIVLANLYRFKQQDIVSAASNNKHNATDVETPDHTTAKVMKRLGYRSQPEEHLANQQESNLRYSKAGTLFAQETNRSAYASGENAHEIAPQMAGSH